MKVLVVDDEASIIRLFEQRFRKEIHEGSLSFIFAASGEEALERYKAEGGDLVMILSDINMPGMNGLELLKALKQIGSKVPVWMISAYDNDTYQEQSAQLGADGFIPKPLDFDVLKELLSRYTR